MVPLRAAAAIVLLCATASLAAGSGSARVTAGSARGGLRVEAVEAPLSRVLSAAAMRTGRPMRLAAPDRLVTYDFTAKDADDLLARICRAEGLAAETSGEGWVLRDPAAAAVTMDVVDAELGEILGIVKRQCGIRNIVVDPGVTGKGTFLFRAVPCDNAIRTIFATLGLSVEMQTSVVRVKR